MRIEHLLPTLSPEAIMVAVPVLWPLLISWALVAVASYSPTKIVGNVAIIDYTVGQSLPETLNSIKFLPCQIQDSFCLNGAVTDSLGRTIIVPWHLTLITLVEPVQSYSADPH